MELKLEQQEIVRPAVAVKMQAWVRYGNVPVRVAAEAVAWTQFAVAVRWQGLDTAIHKAWVWAVAVRSRD